MQLMIVITLLSSAHADLKGEAAALAKPKAHKL